jgi:hypothetical protein
MESLIDNLYYSTEEKILFWVAGYTDNYHEVDEIKQMLDECVKEFETVIPRGVKFPIKTDYITESRRYKNMRYFYVSISDENFVPRRAFELDKSWTMYSWLHD